MYPRPRKSLHLLVNHTENKYFCVSSHKLWEAGNANYVNLDFRGSLGLDLLIANYGNKHILELLIKFCFHLHLHKKIVIKTGLTIKIQAKL